MTLRHSTVLCFCLLAWLCRAGTPVRYGADVLVERDLDLLRGHRVGIITNQTGVLSTGTTLIDTLVSLGIQVTALFSPEHGIGGGAAAGESVRDTVDAATGIRVYSLYGVTRKPTAAMLRAVDLLVYDLQDVGARFFTHISTMKLAMEAAAEAGLPFIVLDRPNPLGGLFMDGPVLEDSLRSFVGAMPVPVVYALTCGELAQMINGEGWLSGGRRVHLTVVRMKGWRRSMRWEETHLRWIRPSPSMVSEETALLYPGLCIIEATNLSEGRGTENPFQMIGAPWVDAERMARAVTDLHLPGVDVSPVRFIPAVSKHAGKACGGIRVDVGNPAEVDPLATGMSIFREFRRLYPDSVDVDVKFLGRLLGSATAADRLLRGDPPQSIRETWQVPLQRYRKNASKYVVYEE